MGGAITSSISHIGKLRVRGVVSSLPSVNEYTNQNSNPENVDPEMYPVSLCRRKPE